MTKSLPETSKRAAALRDEAERLGQASVNVSNTTARIIADDLDRLRSALQEIADLHMGDTLTEAVRIAEEALRD